MAGSSSESPAETVRYHVNPDTGQPNKCTDGDTCAFGSDAFHYATKHDAEIAWQARQLERGVIAYRNVMRAKEAEEEEAALARLAGKAKGVSKKISWSVVRSVAVKNLSKYSVNLLGVFVAYAVASGKWLTDDWIRRLLPTMATVVLIALLVWFGLKFAKGTRKATVAVKQRRIRRAVRADPRH
jgi:hypothetical protein